MQGYEASTQRSHQAELLGRALRAIGRIFVPGQHDIAAMSVVSRAHRQAAKAPQRVPEVVTVSQLSQAECSNCGEVMH